MAGLYTAWRVGSLYYCILVKGIMRVRCTDLCATLGEDPGAGLGVQGTWAHG
jgi:hypothetical protein